MFTEIRTFDNECLIYIIMSTLFVQSGIANILKIYCLFD